MIEKFRKKPIVIEAIQWTGNNTKEVFEFIGTNKIIVFQDSFRIKTLEGIFEVISNDWIIKGVNGEFYPCKPDIFEKTYDKVND